MKTIPEEKSDLEDNFHIKQDQISEKLSVSASCASGYQDSIEESRKGRYYASFSFRFKSKASSDKNQFLSDGDQMRMDQFFDDEIIFEKKVDKREIVFRPGCLNSRFIKSSSELIFKFCQAPDQRNFQILLEQISIIDEPIFELVEYEQSAYTINQALEDLFYRKEHTFLIYTFDLSICHMSFMCCLLIYWMQIQAGQTGDHRQGTNKNRQEYIKLEKIKLKQNLSYITLSYTQQRSQEINTHQPVLLILYHFLNYLKMQPCLDIVEISRTQDKLINDIKLFRRIKRKEKEFSQLNNEIIVESQLRKYEFENKLITSQQKTYTLLNLICSHNYVSCPLLKYYQLDQYKDSRTFYQAKKDYFCLWVLGIVLNQCQDKANDSLHNASLYILIFLGIIKRMKKQGNLEGLSYIVPILANIQNYLPKLWKYVQERRPEIDAKLSEYVAKLTKKQYKTEQLSQGNSIIWNETIFEMTEKMHKFMSSKQSIDLSEHRQFYQQFLVHFLHYRRNVQKSYRQEIEKYDNEKQIGSSFNMYLLDTYVPRVFEGKNLEQEWSRFKRRAEAVNNKISISFYNNLVNYCFVGSSVKFQKIDI